MKEDFDLVEEIQRLPDDPARLFAGAFGACSFEDLRTAIEEMARMDVDKLFDLVGALCEANPVRKVPGPARDYIGRAYLVITGLAPGVNESSARVAGMRYLREWENSTIKEANTICLRILAGQPHRYPEETLNQAESRAARWRAAGYACRIVPVGDPPAVDHEESLVEALEHRFWT